MKVCIQVTCGADSQVTEYMNIDCVREENDFYLSRNKAIQNASAQ